MLAQLVRQTSYRLYVAQNSSACKRAKTPPTSTNTYATFMILKSLLCGGVQKSGCQFDFVQSLGQLLLRQLRLRVNHETGISECPLLLGFCRSASISFRE